MSQYFCGSASHGEIAILAFDCDSQGKILNLAERYNLEEVMWRNLPSINKPHMMCSKIFKDGKFCVIGCIRLENQNQSC